MEQYLYSKICNTLTSFEKKRKKESCLLHSHRENVLITFLFPQQLYTELPGHVFTLYIKFKLWRGKVSINEKALSIVKEFAEAGKPIATTCHSQLMLISAGLLKGKKCFAFPSLKPIIEFAGGNWWARLAENPLGIDIYCMCYGWKHFEYYRVACTCWISWNSSTIHWSKNHKNSG